MRVALFAAAMVASVSAGATAAVVDARPPHVDLTSQAGPPMCEPVSFNVYFEHSKTGLSEPAERTLDVVGHQIKGCDIAAVSISSSAQDVSSAEGRHIAGLRGAEVLKALKARGVTPDAVVVTRSGSLTEPASSTPEHVTISIDANRAPLSAERDNGTKTDV